MREIGSVAASVAWLVAALLVAGGPQLVLAQDHRAGKVLSAAAPGGYSVVDLAVGGERAATIRAYLRRPPGVARSPAVVGFHDCAGLFDAHSRLRAREAEWGERLVAQGYAVLFPDSFSGRGIRAVCRLGAGQRPIRPVHRARDATAALVWLAAQPFIDRTRLALIGWSHGGSTVLNAVDARLYAEAPPLKAAVAFYPGCRTFVSRRGWSSRAPLTILIGSADNWTPPAPCRELAQRAGIRLVEYAGAVHGFDAPGQARRTLHGVGISASGTGDVEIGTDPAARATAFAEVDKVLARALAAR